MRSSRFPCLLTPVVVFALALPAGAESAAPATSPWDQAALGLFKEAHTTFVKQPASDRESRFGEAITLLNLQPKTDANLDRAAVLFTEIAAANPSDDLGISSRYFSARIPQAHRNTPDPAAALDLFRKIDALNSPHPLAQRAVVQIALIELFEPRLPADEVRARFDRLAARSTTLTHPSVLRDFHLVLGDAALRFAFADNLALDHLLAADRAGLARAVTKRDTWLRIAEIARRSGRADIAVDYYQRFLDASLRDTRRTLVKERLAALSAP